MTTVGTSTILLHLNTCLNVFSTLLYDMNELSIDWKLIHNHKVVLQLLSFVFSLATHQSPIHCLFVSAIYPPSMQLTSCLCFRCKLFNVGIQLRNVGCSVGAVQKMSTAQIFSFQSGFVLSVLARILRRYSATYRKDLLIKIFSSLELQTIHWFSFSQSRRRPLILGH